MTPQLLIGTYTEPLPHVNGKGEGIVVADFDGTLETRSAAQALSPSWLAVCRSGQHVYSVNEAGGGAAGGLSVFRRSHEGLTLEQNVESGGVEPAHLALSADESFVVVANYGDGVVSVFERRPDGLLGAMTERVVHTGSGPHALRQTSPHPHHVSVDPRTSNILVTDLGIDSIAVYSVSATGRLNEVDRVFLEPGEGPRHLAFHPDGEHLFVINELGSSIAVFERSGSTFERRATVSTLPAGFVGLNQASAIRVAPDGRTVYASNRGHNSIAVFGWSSRALAVLHPIQFADTQGRTPRDFTISASGRWVHVANQDSNTVAIFVREPSGVLGFVGRARVPTPACLVLVDE